MAWTVPSTWTAGQTVTAAQLNEQVRDNMTDLDSRVTAQQVTYAIKSATESVAASTTLQNDDHLSYTVAEAGSFIIDCYLFVTGTTGAGTADVKFGFTFPTGTFHFSGLGPATAAGGAIDNSTGNWQAQPSATSGTSTLSFGLTSSNAIGVHLHGILIATAPGTLRLQWAQNTSDAGSTQLLVGSHMLVTQAS